MADQIKRHIIARKAQYLLSLVGTVFAISIYVALVGGFGAAYAAPTGVTLTDVDTIGYGLDGRDVTVSWTPGSQPAGFQFTKVIFVTSTVNITAQNHDNYFGQLLFDYTISSVTFNQSMPFDGSMATLTTSSQYVAWLVVSSTIPSVVSSSPVTLTFDSPTDTAKPGIEHIGVHTEITGQKGYFHAFIQDDQTTLAQFGDAADGGAEYFQMVYSTTTFGTSSSTVNATHLGNGLFEFQVPTAQVPSAGNTYRYYMKAADRAGNSAVFCAGNSATTEAACQTSPFIVNVVAAGTTRSISGTVSKPDMSTTIAAAFVFAGGSANQSTSSSPTGTGAYTLSGLKDNNGYDIIAGGKTGYCKSGGQFKVLNGSNLSGVDIQMMESVSTCFLAGQGGGGGTSEFPMPMFSNPPEGSFGHAIDKSIVVGFNTALDASSIAIADASVGNPSIYLTSDNGTTKVPGKVFYCATKNSTAECTSALHDGDTNAIVFDPASNLTTSKQYILEISSTIKSITGLSISGNLPGGGHRITFNTFAGTFNENTNPLGSGAAYMPPYVRSMVPAPGIAAKVNTNVVLEFSEAMNTTIVDSSRITLWKIVSGSATAVSAAVTLDSTGLFAAIDPASNLSTGEYEVRVKGSSASQKGITMRPAAQASENAFSSRFNVESGSDTTAPTMYSQTTDASTGVTVSVGRLIFGFNEGVLPTTINTSNVSLKRGSTAVAARIKYDAGLNQVSIIPSDVLAPNTQYSAIFSRSVTDIAGVALSATQTINFTTGGIDQTQPKIIDGRCDDSNCMVRFNEPMNHVGPIDNTNYPYSAINTSSISISVNNGANKMTGSGVTVSYDENENMVKVSGLSGMTIGGTFSIAIADARDLSGNGIDGTAQIARGVIENGQNTFGNFGGTGMFGPPVSTVGSSGGNATFSEFKPEGFGSFTAAQVFNGETTMVFPFNRTAGSDSNTTQVKYRPGEQIQNGDIVDVVFPAGTTFGTVAMDTNSPFRSDANEFGSGTVTVSVSSTDASANKVRLVVAVTGGSTSANDSYTIDLKGIVNPIIPKGPNTGGYTTTVKHLRTVLGVPTLRSTKTSLPYFIDTAGSNSLNVNVTVAGSPASADGDIKLFGGGQAGAMDKTLTMTNGAISAVDGSATTTVQYAYLPDGCYFFSTEPLITLGGVDYDGKFSGEPKCVGTSMGNATTGTVSIQLSAPGAGARAATTTVAIGGINFNGKDVEIFVGGPSRFRTKKLTSVGNLTSSQVTTSIALTENGTWFIGVGPAMEHGSTGAYKAPEPLPGMAPAPMELIVSGLPSSPSIKAGYRTPQNVQFNDSTDTVTFNFGSAGTAVTGKVQDASGSAVANAQIFVFQQDFGMPVVSQTNASGTFSLSIGNPGSYQFGVRKDGLPSVQGYFELRDSKVYYNKVDVTSVGMTIVISKPDYYISGKVLDSDENPVTYAPVMAVGTDGMPIPGQTDSSGNYTVYVNNGTYTVRVELPPSTEACGSFSKSVTVSGANMTSQNIEQTETSCKTLSGTISVGGTGLASTPVFIQETTAGGTPVVGGERKNTVTDSSGAYSLTISPSKVYRLAFWHPDYGEKGVSVTMGTENATQNISLTASNVGFAFTGGTATMNGFIELKNSSDATKRVSKSVSDLSTAETLAVESGQTYNYFVDVFGFGKFNGSIVAGTTTTLDVSTSNLITVSGTIRDGSGNALSGALVTFNNSSTLVYETALTDANGNYTATLRASGSASDRYLVAASLAGYVQPEASKLVAFTTGTDDYDFGGNDSPEHVALALASRTISGTITDSDGNEMTDGFVMATNNSTGAVVKAAIEGDGTYSLAVATGTWSIEALGPRHAKTEASSDPVITSADATANITLTSASSRVTTSTVGVVAGNTGGSVDSEETDMKITAGAGVLQTGSGNVTLNMERSYTAPDSETVRPLGNVMYDIEATGNSSIKTLNGNIEIQIDYTDFLSDIPSGIDESDLVLNYYSPERGEYIPVEGGYTVDTANNTITGQVAHLTGFSIGAPGGEGVAAASSPSNSTPSTNNNTNNGGGGGGGGLAPFGSNPPTLVSGTPAISINGGAASTDKTQVTLSLNVKGAYTMIISNTDNYDGLTYVAYASSTSWKLSEGNGKKTVYVRFRSLEGGILPATAQITLTGQATDEAPITTPPAAQCSLDMGSAYKTADTPAVWYITESCTKRAFVSAQKFFTYFTSWSEVKVTTKAALGAVANDTLGFMPSGPLYDPKYGALVKIVSDPKVYLLLGNKRHWITSETVFESLKYAWNWIEDVAVGLLDKYESAGEITYTDHHPNNTIVKYANSTAVYRLETDPADPSKQIKRHIKNEKAFEKLGFRWDRIVTIDATEVYADGAVLE